MLKNMIQTALGAALLLLQMGTVSAIGFPAHPARDAEVARHKQALLYIKKREIDARTEYKNAAIRCQRNLGCINDARVAQTSALGECKILRNTEDALHKKNMLDLALNGEPAVATEPATEW